MTPGPYLILKNYAIFKSFDSLKDLNSQSERLKRELHKFRLQDRVLASLL